MTILLAMSICGCSSKLAWFAPTSVPLGATNTDVATGVWVDVEQCRHWMLYLFPFREPDIEGGTEPFHTGYLIKKAASREEAIIEMSIDRSFRWWLVGYSDCQRLTGYRVFIHPPE